MRSRRRPHSVPLMAARLRRHPLALVVLTAALALILLDLYFFVESEVDDEGFGIGGRDRAITTEGRRAPPVYERNCPDPSPGLWCPWVDDGEVQPQPVWRRRPSAAVDVALSSSNMYANQPGFRGSRCRRSAST